MNHIYELYVSTQFKESSPVQVDIFLHHEDPGDMCLAYVIDTIAFDLTPLTEYYLILYGSREWIQINVLDHTSEEIKYSLLYYPNMD